MYLIITIGPAQFWLWNQTTFFPCSQIRSMKCNLSLPMLSKINTVLVPLVHNSFEKSRGQMEFLIYNFYSINVKRSDNTTIELVRVWKWIASVCALHSKLASEWPKHTRTHTHHAAFDWQWVCAHSAYELTHIDMRKKKSQSAFSISAPPHSHSDRVENFQI